VEEFERPDSPSARPNITDILGQLGDEEKTWGPSGGQLTLPIIMERKASGVSFISAGPIYEVDTALTAESSIQCFGFLDKFVEHAGLFPPEVHERTRSHYDF
jgi:hypothetical protein